MIKKIVEYAGYCKVDISNIDTSKTQNRHFGKDGNGEHIGDAKESYLIQIASNISKAIRKKEDEYVKFIESEQSFKPFLENKAWWRWKEI